MFDVNTFTWASVKLKCLVMFWITYFLPRLFLWFWNIVKVGYVSENRWLTIVRNDDECLWGRLTSNHPAHIWNSYLQRANFNMNIQRLLLTTTTRVHSFIFRLRIEEKLHNVGTLRPHKRTQTLELEDRRATPAYANDLMEKCSLCTPGQGIFFSACLAPPPRWLTEYLRLQESKGTQTVWRQGDEALLCSASHIWFISLFGHDGTYSVLLELTLLQKI